MKKTQSNLPNPKSVQKKAQTDLPLPQPMELACLAAILRPGSKPESALKLAMELYVEAVLFSRELPSSFEELVTRFGSEKRWMELVAMPPFTAALEGIWADTLELDPDPEKDDDPARGYLAEQGLPLKKAKSVIEKLRRYCQSLPPEVSIGADSIIERCKRMKNGVTTYAIPRRILQRMVDYANSRHRESKRLWWDTQKSREKPAQKTVKQKVKKSSA